MFDEKLKPWLIEFNANPCLEVSCSVLNRIIPALIENVWKVAIDPIFPPPLEVLYSHHLLYSGRKRKNVMFLIIPTCKTNLS
jgi:hypothetical protein